MIRVYRDSNEILKVKLYDGEQEKEYSVKPIMYFPLTKSCPYLSLFELLPDHTIGEELVLISDLAHIDLSSKKLIEEELKKTSPLEEITKVYSIKQVSSKLKWDIETADGVISLEVEEKNIIRLQSIIFFKMQDNKKYLINLTGIDPRSQKIIDTFV